MKASTFYLKCGEEYLQFIRDIQNRGRNLVPERGYNIHHIHPRGLLGNKSDPDNLVKLTLMEHCIAHALLFKALPRQATSQALICVATRKQYQSLTEEEKSFLETEYGWSELVQQAYKIPKTYKVRMKIRESRKGWQPSEETRARMSQSHLGKNPVNKGRIAVNNGEIIKYIVQDKLEEYTQQGWVKGTLPFTEERRNRISKNSKGHRWSEESKLKKREQMGGTVRLYKEGEPKTIRVPMSEKDSYLEQGWTTVRKGTDRSSAYKRASQTRNAQRKFSKDGVRKWFNPDQFNQALSEGWVPVRPLT